MTTTHKLLRIILVLLVCLLVPACKDKVTKANFEKIKKDMTLEEVQAILGKGEKETGDGSNVAGQFGVAVMTPPTVGAADTYVWESGDKKITVYIKQDKVINMKAEGLDKK